VAAFGLKLNTEISLNGGLPQNARLLYPLSTSSNGDAKVHTSLHAQLNARVSSARRKALASAKHRSVRRVTLTSRAAPCQMSQTANQMWPQECPDMQERSSPLLR
jgi:hypothetical protein